MSNLDVLRQYLKTVYFHLKNKKKEQKKFLEFIDANNSYEFQILLNNKMINRVTSSSRLAIRKKLSKILCIYI
jgi:hypothetical protein